MNLLIAIIFLGILVAIHEAGHYWAARLTGMKVEKYSIGFFKPIFTWTSPKSGISYQLGSLPLGGFVKIKGMNPFEENANDADSYQTQAYWKRMLVLFSGPFSNFLLAWLILFALVAGVGLPNQVDTAGIGTLTKDWPAHQAGLKPGDKILKVNEVKTQTFEELAKEISENPDKEILILIERDKKRWSVPVTPKNNNGIGQIGITPPIENVSLAPHKAAAFALDKSINVISDSLSGLWGMISRTRKDVQPVGPPGIVKIASEQLEHGMVNFLAFVAYISLMLFLFNLLPIPALDGGRGLFLIYEVITRRKVNQKFEIMITNIFFFLLMGLILYISTKELFF